MGDNNAQVFLQEDMQLPAIKWLGEQVPGGFFVYLADESQQIVFANNACQRLFGCVRQSRQTAQRWLSFQI